MIEPQVDAPEPAREARGPSRRVVALAALGVAVAVLALAAVLARGPEGPREPMRRARPHRRRSPGRRHRPGRPPYPGHRQPLPCRRSRTRSPAPSSSRWLPSSTPHWRSARRRCGTGGCRRASRTRASTCRTTCPPVRCCPPGSRSAWASWPMGRRLPRSPTDCAPDPARGPGACPQADVPSSPGGAVLVSCTGLRTVSYTHDVPDTRLEDGLWVLTVTAKDSTSVRPAAIVPVLVDGVVAAYG